MSDRQVFNCYYNDKTIGPSFLVPRIGRSGWRGVSCGRVSAWFFPHPMTTRNGAAPQFNQVSRPQYPRLIVVAKPPILWVLNRNWLKSLTFWTNLDLVEPPLSFIDGKISRRGNTCVRKMSVIAIS